MRKKVFLLTQSGMALECFGSTHGVSFNAFKGRLDKMVLQVKNKFK